MASFDRFATPVARIEDLAPAVCAALQARLLPGEVARQIVFAPRQDRPAKQRSLKERVSGWFSWQQTPQWVLALTEERLLVAIIDDPSRPPEVSVAPLADLLWLELGTILLYSWLAWSWADAGQPRQERVYFNTVRDNLFWAMLDAMRRTIIAQADRPQPEGERDYLSFVGLPFKFRNLIPLRLLFPGEQAEVLVYQPAIWRRRLGVFRQQRAPTTVVTLTPQHLLVAQDDLTNIRAAYGLIARYCPRDRVRGIALERTGSDLWLRITLAVSGTEETFRLLFEPRVERPLEALIAALS